MCKKCGYPEVVLEGKEATPRAPPGPPSAFETPLPGWGCPLCTFANMPDSAICEICETPRPGREEKKGGREREREREQEQPKWSCPKCTYLNAGDAEVCEICEYSPEQTGQTDIAEAGVTTRVPSREQGQEGWILDLAGQTFLGAHYISEGLVLFQVWAPHAARVFVAGSFNAWEPGSPDFELERQQGELSGYFLGLFGDVPHNSEYKYVIDTEAGERLWRNDPRACFLVRRFRGTNSLLYDPLSFKFSPFSSPRWSEMVLYEMHVGSFCQEGTFRGCIPYLSYLKELGVNALALMPINEDHHPSCWGYDPISLFAIHPPYGDPKSLQEFVEAAHREGLAVILDWIPNHMCGRNILRNFDEPGSEHGGPFFYPDERSRTDYGPKLNYSSAPVRRYLKDSVWMFLTAFNFDGVRVDSTVTMRRQVPEKEEQNVEAWTLMQEITEMVHQKLPGKILIAEDLQGDPRINYSLAGFDSQWDPRLFSTLFVNARNPSDHSRDLGQIVDAICYRPHPSLHSRVIYIENHDTIPGDRQKRFPEAIIPGGGDSNFFAIKRTTLCVSILMISPGIPMLLQGQEILETACPEWPHPPHVDWGRKGRFPGIFKLHQDLIALRTNRFRMTRGLTAAGVVVSHLNENCKIAVLHRFDLGGAGDDVMVIFNFSNSIFPKYEIGFPRPGIWRVRFNCDSKKYWPHFEGVGNSQIQTRDKPYDGFFFSGSLSIGRYSLLILSMDPQKI